MANVNLLNQLAGSVVPQGDPFNPAQAVADGQQLQMGNSKLELLRQKIAAERQQETLSTVSREIMARAASGQTGLGQAGREMLAVDPSTGIQLMEAGQAENERMAADQQRAQTMAAIEAYAAQNGLDPAILAADPEGAIGTIQGNLLASPDPAKAPPTRDRYDGTNVIQEEYVNGEWVPFGRGPRSATGGLNLEFGEGGNLLGMSFGGPASKGQELQRSMQKNVQDAALNSANALARLENIEMAFNPSVLRVPDRLGTWASKMKAKWAITDLSEDEKQKVRAATDMLQSSFHNMNTTLKELSGAAVSAHEMERLKEELPNPGKGGLFNILSADGDDPVTFERKMRNLIRWNKNAIARYNWYLFTNKIEDTTPKQDPNAPSVIGKPEETGIEKIIDEKGAELEAHFKEKYGPDANVKPFVAAELQKIFGIAF